LAHSDKPATQRDPMTQRFLRTGVFLAPFHPLAENPLLALDRDMDPVRQTQPSRTLTNSLRILLGIVPYRDNLGPSRPFGPIRGLRP
jgi:hypothetical protein